MNTENQKLLHAYAELVIKKGVALYKGQNLNITTGYKNYEFACILAEAAYKTGASYVAVDVVSNLLTKVRIENSEEDGLEYVPEFSSQKYAQMCAEDWAFVRIDDTEELDTLSGVPVSSLGIYEKALRKSKHIFYKNLLGNKITWCVICAPGPQWAAYVTGGEDEDALMDVLKPVLRLNTDDPLNAWKEHGEKLIERRAKLNAMRLQSLRFQSEGTDLKIGLIGTSRWKGGPSHTLDGRQFSANIPTEEVFTTPDYRLTEGRVRVTRPLKVLETIVEGASFVFQEGKVTDFTAEKGADVLEQYFAIDEGAKQLGEVALVGSDSPLTKSGKLFGSILYDENASCHIALGSGYPSCLSNMNELHGDNDLKEAGCNISLVHTDFMIGSGSTKVIGVESDGKEVVIMENGLFVI